MTKESRVLGAWSCVCACFKQPRGTEGAPRLFDLASGSSAFPVVGVLPALFLLGASDLRTEPAYVGVLKAPDFKWPQRAPVREIKEQQKPRNLSTYGPKRLK